MKAILKGIPILLVVLILLIVTPIPALSAPGDLFTVDDMTYKVLTESGTTGTVQIGDGRNTAISRNTTGALNIPATVLWNGSTYTVTSIGVSAFVGCRSLTSVIIPNSVTSIGDMAFFHCESLRNVTIPNSVTRIDAAFGNCYSLTSIIIPSSVRIISVVAFSGCVKLTGIDVSLDNPEYSSENGVLFNKAKTLLHSYPSAKGAYTIPNSVTSIGSGAFRDCKNLTSVTIPNSVRSIGGAAFEGCRNLTELWFEGNAPTVAPDTFYNIATGAVAYVNRTATGFQAPNWNRLSVSYHDTINTQPVASTDVTLSSTTILEEQGVFVADGMTFRVLTESGTTGTVQVGYDNNAAINSNIIGALNIPATVLWNGRTYTVTSIGKSAFSRCTSLTSVTIPDNVTIINDDAFSGCSRLASIAIPNSVTSIGNGAFAECYRLTSVTIGNSVTSIGDAVFNNCINLTSITIPNSVTNIGKGAFSNCNSLTNITIPNSVISIEERTFIYCTRLTRVTIPSSVTIINDDAFRECTNLTSVTIPDSVTRIGKGAFSDCVYLTGVTIPNSVTNIGNSAFANCISLTEVWFEGDAPTVDSNAFNKVTTGAVAYVFKTAAGFPAEGQLWNRLTVRHRDAINTQPAANTNVTQDSASAKLGDLFTVNGMTFRVLTESGKTGTVQVGDNSRRAINKNTTIPATVEWNEKTYAVTSIGYRAFYDCENLTSVTIPNSVTSIGYRAFSNCVNLASVTIPNSVTSIGEYAFSGCRNLTSVTIPNSVTSIGKYAFSGCRLKSITIPDSVVSIGSGAFSCSDLMSVRVSRGNPAYFSENGVLFNKSMTLLHTYPGDKAGAYTIPNSVTSIGDYAFINCSSLTSITIPNSVSSIGDSAFWQCSILTNITIPDSVTNIGSNAFELCRKLTEVWFEGDAPTVGSDSFPRGAFAYVHKTATGFPAEGQNWKELKVRLLYDNSKGVSDVFTVDSIQYRFFGSTGTAWVGNGSKAAINSKTTGAINIPATVLWNERTYTVTIIDDYAFNDCSSLTSVTIPNNVIRIGNYAFSGCRNLTSVTIGNGVTSIGNYAFSYCTDLTSVTIPNSVTSIGERAFSGCSNLTSVTIGNGVTSIGNYAFSYCTDLTSVTIPNSVTSIGDRAFSGCSNLTSVTIPDSMTSIGDSAFYDCRNLTSVIIPDSVTSIGKGSFMSCVSLTGVTIPNSVTSIGVEAFFQCRNLTEVWFDGDAPIVDSRAFSSIATGAVAYVHRTATGFPAEGQLWNGLRVRHRDFVNTKRGDLFIVDGISFKVITESETTGTVQVGDDRNAAINSETTRVLNIPDTVSWNGKIYDLTSIGNSAFAGCRSLISVTIPNSVTSIGNNAFSGCSSLTSVTIPNSVTSIGNMAFSGCNSLKSVTIPNSVTNIVGAFANCSSLKSVTIPNSVTNIGDFSFFGCSKLTSVYFDGDAPTVDWNAFSYVDDYAVAYINKTATGFPAEGQDWNGLAVKHRGIISVVTRYGYLVFALLGVLLLVLIRIRRKARLND